MNKIFKKTSIAILFITLISNVFSQDNTIYGYIYDEYSNEPMAGVNVYLDSTYHTYSDINGCFKLNNVTQGRHLVKVTCMGYYTQEKEININSQCKEFNLNFLLNYGPQFSKSTKFNRYHNNLKNLYNNNHSIFRIEPNNIENNDSGVNIGFCFINDSDESIFVTKYNFGIYISDSLGSVIQWVSQYVVCLDFFYGENDVIKIKKKNKFTHSCFIPYDDTLISQNLQEYKYVVLEYYFDIKEPACTTGVFKEFPTGDNYRKLENTYCKLFRIPVKSKPLKLDCLK